MYEIGDLMSKKEHPVATEWEGEAYALKHCDKADKSYDKEIQHVAPTRKQERFQTFFRKTYERVTTGQRLSSDSVAREAAIKGTAGLSSKGDMNFYAFKKLPMRSYFWYSPYREKLIFVSHYKFKNYTKLDSTDTEKVKNNFFLHDKKGS
jgi:hypothetical protein